jgi:Domain of unknown function (DUF4158)
MSSRVLLFPERPIRFEIPGDISERELIRYFTLAHGDQAVALKCRGIDNQLGFALSGYQEFLVQDPDGYLLRFSQHLGFGSSTPACRELLDRARWYLQDG